MKTRPMRIRFGALAVWVLITEALVGLVGLWPAWKLAGPHWIDAGILAGVTVVPLLLGSGLLTLWAARKGPAWAAFTFVSAGVLRMILCMILALVLLHSFVIEPFALVVCMLGAYLAGLAGEGIWLCRALNLDAHRSALGDFDSGPSSLHAEA